MQIARYVAGCLIACGLSFGAAVYGDDAKVVEQRITAVEQGLRPTVRIKGRSATWSLAERMHQRHVPGVSIAVINQDKIEWAKAYGVADVTTGATTTTDTLFQAASVSKPISALAALRLVQDGVLALDRNVNDQLKSWKVPDNKYTAEHAVDLRSLLSHSAGTTVHGFPGYKPGDPLPSVAEILDGKTPANTLPVRVNKLPGQSFRYSGGGTTIVQLLVTDATGRPYADGLRETVLVPLGMTASSFDQPIARERESLTAAGHDAEGKTISLRVHVYPEQAAAGLWTTPTDVARYVLEVQRAHEGRSAKVIEQRLVDEMLTPQAGGPAGLGPMIAEKDGVKRFSHGGQNLGFNCQFIGLLDRGQGAVVMSNSDVGGPLVAEVVNSIAAAYDWPGYFEPERAAIELDSATLDRYVGKYSLGVAGSYLVRRDGNRLLSRATMGGPELELFFATPTEFFADVPGASGRFVVEGDAGASEMVIDSAGRPLKARRLPAK